MRQPAVKLHSRLLAARVVLKGVANNLNQLTKWANANRALPPHLDHLVEDLARAVVTTEETAAALGGAFELGQGNANGLSKRPTMIAKVTQGASGRALIRYLFGPGKANEHTDQRVVTSGIVMGVEEGRALTPPRDHRSRRCTRRGQRQLSRQSCRRPRLAPLACHSLSMIVD